MEKVKANHNDFKPQVMGMRTNVPKNAEFQKNIEKNVQSCTVSAH